MYAGNYGYPNNPAGSPQYNGAPPPGSQQNSAMQPGTASNQMMYNAQQFPMGAQPGTAFPGNPNMMAGVAPPGMMQNTGMPHMANANGQMPNFQPPYSNSAYGAGVPSSVPPQMNMPPNYAMGTGMPMAGFPMQQGMNPQQQQQMMQRMQVSQPNPNMSTPTPQRNFQGQPPQGTPTPGNGQPLQQPQFPGPPNVQGPHHGQPVNNTPQQQQHQHQPMPPSQTPVQTPTSNNIQTPQTPTFPPHAQGGGPNGMSSASTPLSPGADPKDKERVGVILEINNELLLEAVQIQSTQHIIKKERAAMNGTEGHVIDGDKKSAEEEQLAQDYIHCMRRLQTNLAYLAGLADKERKPTQPSQQFPAYLKPPPLNASIKLRQVQTQEGGEVKTDMIDREETIKYIGELYKKLQALFPEMDPNKEPGARPTAQAINSTQSGSQTPGQASPVPGKQSTPIMTTSAPPQLMNTGVPAP
ncbi:hypothetical protein F5B22DRAFT_606303 [Xylaria bambusicola]|uniref:uncharacterized protein n=1 Tax=Xylaria bambusicola TaxID=326684 RepID=UPI002008E7AB|nr:uncharacterized protein F5B22DRAFT_606303 [Xylaria bambusicola]KAI0516729.1 hypothetical protein F5B22DRAFT_606303 [Xylaria bambusicola]